MNLRDLDAKFTQHVPLADGIYTGLYYRCPNDPRKKRAHAILFRQIIVPIDYASISKSIGGVQAFVDMLNRNESYRVAPKWNRRGTTLDDLTLDPSIGQPARRGTHGECCHLTITAGTVTSV